jgi:NAD(P)-dependent dehydrogenase (short-subunit alcohol dehydrogenase family)
MTTAPAGGVLSAFRLDGRVAVVTGGNRGLGRAIAQALAEAGADVGVVARDGGSCAEAAAELAALGGRTASAAMDVTDPGSIEAAVEAVEAELGPIGVWVNNAGITHWGATLDLDAATGWRDVLAVNLDGLFHCSRAIGRRMVARRSGAIVNIGSISGIAVNRPQWQPAYNASKAAVHQLTRSLAGEWAPFGVRVNALAPGFVRTDMVAPRLDDPAYRPHWVDNAAQRRAAAPSELGPPAVFLASDASSYMTGAIVVVDGGYTLW